MGNLPVHIYGYNNEHDVIVYTVVQMWAAMLSFSKVCFSPFTLKRNPGVFKLKQGLQHFQNSKTPE